VNLAVGGLVALLLFIFVAMIFIGIPEMWSIPLVLAGLGFAKVVARPLGGRCKLLHLIVSVVAIVLMLAFIFLVIFFAVQFRGD
jgi:hypothetical protein